jgi:hypothetical protein
VKSAVFRSDEDAPMAAFVGSELELTTRSRLSVSQEAVTEGSAKAVVQLP